MPVAVVTDSTHYMPREIAERHGFHTVSLYVRWGDPPRDDREADLPDFDAFYDHLRSARELPTTSQPSVGDFLAVYEPLIEAGSDILSIHLSGGISGTVRSAEQARDQLVEQGVDAEPDRGPRQRERVRRRGPDGGRRGERGRRGRGPRRGRRRAPAPRASS